MQSKNYENDCGIRLMIWVITLIIVQLFPSDET